MKFTETPIAGAYLVEMELLEDERGFFARSWCVDEFSARGLNPALVQSSISFNRRKGTVRGLHYQAVPHAEAKLVRCTRGRIFDVVADVRTGSPTFGKWHGVELSADNRRALYIAEGIAHGFQTLEDECEVLYQMSQRYHPEAARGVRWDDPALAIPWKDPGRAIVSERDRNLPGLKDPQ